MFSRRKRAFGLDYSLHTSFFEVKTDCAGGEGLINDIGEGFGDLDSIFCPSSEDETDSIMDVGGGKHFWTTTSGLLKVRICYNTSKRAVQRRK
jgi:hypothetical protein